MAKGPVGESVFSSMVYLFEEGVGFTGCSKRWTCLIRQLPHTQQSSS